MLQCPHGLARDYGPPSGMLREPDQAVIDLSLRKAVQLHWPKEGASAQLRADFFHALNHANFCRSEGQVSL
jgi:hypothetical protein